MQYYISYVLGLKPNEENGWTIPKPQFKADQGSLVHKSLELLARKKLAIQQGDASFSEGEIGKTWHVATFDAEKSFEESWLHYTTKAAKIWDWSPKEYKKCKGWMYDALEMNSGLWNPLNRVIVQPEQYFDMELEFDWAKYVYVLPDGGKLEGRLAIKGTVDLLTKVSDDTLEYLDWKTGMRKDWATGKPKDWRKLREDPQLRLYHYALAKLYPDINHFILTIVYVQDGGAFSLDFGPQDLEKTEKMLRERFETIKNCTRPPRIRNNGYHKWKCQRLCAFGMNEWEDTGKAVCDHLHDELMTLGMDRVIAKHGEAGAFKAYGSGGGVENRDQKVA